MATVRDIYALMNEKAPFSMQESWDNSGLLVGHWDGEVRRVLLALDLTPEVILEAERLGCELILSHHPVIFGGLKQATDGDYTGKRVLMLAERHIAALCCHTCLDSAPGGVNDVLAALCGLKGEIRLLEQSGTHPKLGAYGIGRVGSLSAPLPMEEYLTFLKQTLGPNGLRFHDAGKPVYRVAVGGGSCGSMMGEALAAGCDTFVTADLKHDHFLEAMDAGLNLIDAGHFCTERPVMEQVKAWLTERFPGLGVLDACTNTEPISYR